MNEPDGNDPTRPKPDLTEKIGRLRSMDFPEPATTDLLEIARAMQEEPITSATPTPKDRPRD